LGGTGVVSQNVEDTLDSQISATTTVIDKTPTLSLYDSHRADIISNIQNRATTFTYKWNGTLQDCMDITKQIIKDIVFTNPYEYYNMSNMSLSGTEADYVTKQLL
jgi:predicted thioredoxin/glutaredoxin